MRIWNSGKSQGLRIEIWGRDHLRVSYREKGDQDKVVGEGMARTIGNRLKKIMEMGKCVKLGVTERLEK